MFQIMVLGMKTRATKAKEKKKHKKSLRKTPKILSQNQKANKQFPPKKKKKQQIQIGIIKVQIRKRRIHLDKITIANMFSTCQQKYMSLSNDFTSPKK